MTVVVAPQIQQKTDAEVRNIAVSFVKKLDVGELLTGTVTVTELVTNDLTITTEIVNTSALTINGAAVAIGQAVQFNVSGGTAGKTYRILINVGTDSTPAQTLEGIVRLEVIDNV